MKGNTTNVACVDLFVGIFLLLAGVGLFIVSTAYVMTTFFVLIGLFFLTRTLAQYQELSDISN